MRKFKKLLRYDWPLHFVLLLTNWLPDNVIFLRMRGWLAHWFFGSCGRTLNIGRNVTFHNPAKIHLGNFVHISFGCLFMATDNIWIGDEVMFGPYCILVSGNHGRKNHSYRFGDPILLPIKISKGTWVGAQVTITAGSILGSGSLIAAGAVVTDSFPNNVMVGGVPAKVIKTLE